MKNYIKGFMLGHSLFFMVYAGIDALNNNEFYLAKLVVSLVGFASYYLFDKTKYLEARMSKKIKEQSGKHVIDEARLHDMKSKLIRISASLLTNQMSDCAEDYSRYFPKWVLKQIRDHNEKLRKTAVELRNLSNAF